MSRATWVNRPMVVAIRRTSASDTLSFDVEGKSTVAPDIDRVVFTFSSGAWSQVRTVTTRSMRFPNFSDSPSRLPGGGSTLSPIYCFGTTFLCGDAPVGMVAVSAVVYFSSGTSNSQTLETIYWLNDKDGGDRRGSSAIVYQKGQTGNDATGDGSPGNPVKTLRKALSLARRNPQGDPFNPAHMHCGGATIVCDEETLGCGSLNFPWHTGSEWVTFEALPGFSWRRDPNDSNSDYLICQGVSDAGTCSIRFRNWTQKGVGMILYGATSLDGFGGYICNVTMRAWFDHAERRSAHYNPAVSHSVRYLEDDGQMVGIAGATGATQNALVFHTGMWWHHQGYGVDSTDFVYDIKLEKYIGIAFQPTGRQNDAILNAVVSDQMLELPEIDGRVCVKGGTNFLISQPAANRMRIETTATVYHRTVLGVDTATPTNIAQKLAVLAGTNFWHLHLVAFGPHSGIFPIIETGTTGGGNPYVTVDCTGLTVTPGTAPSSALMRIGLPKVSGAQAEYGTGDGLGSRTYDPHPDIIQYLGDRDGFVHMHIRTENIRQTQGIFLSGNISNGVIYNLTDGGFAPNNPFGASISNCYFGHLSLSGSWGFSGSAMPGTVFSHCMVGVVANLNTSGITVDNCHAVTGTFPGNANNSAGSWFAAPGPSTAPFSFEPLTARQGTGAALNPAPFTWQWPAAKNGPATRGVWGNVGLGNWGDAAQTSGGASAGTSADTAALHTRRTTGGTSAGTSTSQVIKNADGEVGPSQKFVLSGRSSGTSLDFADGTKIVARFSAGQSLGSSGGSAALFVQRFVAGVVSLGTSLDTAFLTDSGAVAASGESRGFSYDSATLVSGLVYIPPTPTSPARVVPVSGVLMKQRIHNALRALVLAGPYYQCAIDKKSGQMTVDLTKPVKPAGVVVKELNRSFRLALKYRREFNVSELEAWPWIVRVEFPALEVACEVFEDNLLDTGIVVPPVAGLPNQRPLLARLSRADYIHPAEQSPNTGTLVDFHFDILPETLRK